MGTARSRAVALALAGAVLALSAGRAAASDPVGVYGFVRAVETDSATAGQPTVRIDGIFAVARPDDPDAYGEPESGYLLLRCPPGSEESCRREWADIAATVDSGDCVAFGARWANAPDPVVRVRTLDMPHAEPEVYPLGMGAPRIRAGPCDALRSAAASADIVPAATTEEAVAEAGATNTEPADDRAVAVEPSHLPAGSGAAAPPAGTSPLVVLAILAVAGGTALAWKRARGRKR
jgi:hypothetical protein